MRTLWMIAALGAALASAIPSNALAAEHTVYSVYKNLDLGNPGEVAQKDYYVNMGSDEGIRPGSVLEVFRKVSTYDLTSEKLYTDVSFPIARLKVIHVQANAAIARLEKMMPPERTPAALPNAVMIGDAVKVVGGE